MLPLNLAAGDRAERMRAMFAGASYFPLLGLLPEHGRFFLPSEDAPGSRFAVAVLSHAAWQRLYGADPGVVGRSILLNGRSFEVVGVAPPGFAGTDLSLAVDLWLPLPMFREISTLGDKMDDRGFALFYALARLKPGVTVEAATADLDSIARQLAVEFPTTDADKGVTLLPVVTAALGAKYRQRYVNFGRTLFACFGLVLLVVCFGVGNLWAFGYFVLRNKVADQLHGVNPGEPAVYAVQALHLFAVGLLGGYLAVRRIERSEPALTAVAR